MLGRWIACRPSLRSREQNETQQDRSIYGFAKHRSYCIHNCGRKGTAEKPALAVEFGLFLLVGVMSPHRNRHMKYPIEANMFSTYVCIKTVIVLLGCKGADSAPSTRHRWHMHVPSHTYVDALASLGSSTRNQICCAFLYQWG